MYYDAHTHLNDDALFPERQCHVQEFIAAGGRGLVCVGTDNFSNERALAIAQESQQVHGNDFILKATVGIHPSEVSFGHIGSPEEIEKRIDELERLVRNHPTHIVAIGECGLDAHYPDFDNHHALQSSLFEAQCRLAQRLDLPLVIHSRDAFEPTFAILSAYPELNIYFHCRGYTPHELQLLLETFPHLWIGFCGNVTYPKAEELRKSLICLMQHDAVKVGRAHLLLETDAPRLSPQSRRGSTNTPTNLKEIYSYIADLLSSSEQDLQLRIEKNWRKLYML